MNKATAHANVNIALIKYWGKRDDSLILPHNGSVSVTLNGYGSITTVEFSEHLQSDSFTLDGKFYESGEEYDRVVATLELIRNQASIKTFARVVSQNEVVTAGGLASSASGAAALATAASQAAGLVLTPHDLSILSRRGSGSATRSVLGGFVEWVRGEKSDGTDSIAQQIVPETYWPEFRMVVIVVSTQQKKIKSRAGMSQTVKSCPYYQSWLHTIPQDVKEIKTAIKNRDFTKVGEITEHNCLKMHALMMTTKPAILYWQPTTLEILHTVYEWREQGLESYFTIDAGPSVTLLCLEKDAPKLQEQMKVIPGVQDIFVCQLGKGAELLDKHLF